MTEQQPEPAQPEEPEQQPEPAPQPVEHEPEPAPPSGPPTIEVATDPFERGEDMETVDQIRNDLLDRLKAEVEAAGWAPAAVDATLRVEDIVDTGQVVLRAEAVLREAEDGRPARWERVHSEAGYRLRLKGANGETVVWSEHYADPRDVEHALALVQHAILAASTATIGVTSAAAATQAKSSTSNPLTPVLVDVEEDDEPEPEPTEAAEGD